NATGGNATGGNASGGDAPCDRECLRGMMDKYADALASKDPKRMPLASNVRFTENGSEMALDEGLWRTFNKFTGYRQDVIDPAQGGVAAYFTVLENKLIPFPDFLAVRLKVVNRRITEIETVVRRRAASAENMSNISPEWSKTMQRVEPAAQRLTREQLVQGAIGYMKAVAFQDGNLGPFGESCVRLENGSVTALGPNDKPPVPIRAGSGPISTTPIPGQPTPAARPNLMGIGCGAKQLSYRSYSFITGYGNARFPIVDVERQLVYTVFDFMRRGDVESWTWNGNTYPMADAMRYPNEILNTEIFKFVDGKITLVEAVFEGPQPYRRGTGWPGGTVPVSRTGP
ncbi:MAG: hypothetical protein ABIO39_09070, partial [Caulobacteraceae bacterium]